MKLKAIFIFLLATIAFSAEATGKPTSKWTPFQIMRHNSILLLRENKLEEALKHTIQLKHNHLIKATKWLYYSSKDNKASFEEIIRFIRQNPSFPEKNKLSQIAEKRITDATDRKFLERWCYKNVPKTANGAKYCLATLTNTKNKKLNPYIAKLAKIVWMKEPLSDQKEVLFMSVYGKDLTKQDHINRLNYVLSKERRLSPLALEKVDKAHREFFRIKLQLADNNKSLNPKSNILNTVEKHFRKDPFFLYLQARWHSSHKEVRQLSLLLKENSTIGETKTDQWFKIRSLLVWDLADEGDYNIAYEVAASHNYKDPGNYADGEWLAGKIAYFNLRNPELAYKHFKNIFKNSKYSVSLARGAYWSGMAARDLGRTADAIGYFKLATKYIDTFYGQLALMKLNDNKIAHYSLAVPPKVTEEDLKWSKNNDLLIISQIFSHAHKDSATRKFIRTALDKANTKGKRYLIAKSGKNTATDLFSTIAGKEAARRGALFVDCSHPMLKTKSENVAIEKSLVNAIIRQESEFNPTAKSSAGASGLMQLMYPTAKEVGNKMGRPITRNALTNPETNVMLGSHYLNHLIERYDGSYVLAVAAYNAGEHRVNEWISKYGDPRKLKKLDKVVAWIEKIPFSETRGYVQSVLSNLQIYRNLVLHAQKTRVKDLHIDLRQDLL